jgi:hypothetical protein
MQANMSLTEVSQRLTTALGYLEQDAWDEGMESVGSTFNYEINLDDRIVHLKAIVDITSRPVKSFKAVVLIEPYDESVERFVKTFFRERNSNFIVQINPSTIVLA